MADVKRRSLWPREHGAYAQLAAPLASALLLWRPALPSVLLAIGAVLAFLANEPLLVTLGHRGKRIRDSEGARARRLLAAFASGALLAGGSGLALAPHAFGSAAIAAAPTALLVLFAVRRAQHSLTGEVLAAIALPAAAIPIAVASGALMERAVEHSLAWSLGYVASVIAVHRVLARNKHPATAADPAILVALLALIAACIALALHVTPIAWLPLPLVAASCVLVAWAPPAKHLRAIGVALVASSVVAIAIAVLVT